MAPYRVGIIGFGKVGNFLVEKILANPDLELAFVCDLFAPQNVLASQLLPESAKKANLDGFEDTKPDLIVEVAHPNVSKDYGARILRGCDYMIASTTTFADKDTEKMLWDEADRQTGNGIYLTPGALFGSLDIQKMSDAGKISKLHVTMKKHPGSLYPLKGTPEFDKNEAAKSATGEVTLFDGPVRELAKIFPVNVNTICTAALASRKTTGMDGTRATLVADASLDEMVIQARIEGPAKPDGTPGLRITVLRENPSVKGEVTGPATMNSFYASVIRVAGSPSKGDGVHLAYINGCSRLDIHIKGV